MKSRGLLVNGRREGSWSFWTDDGLLDAERTGRYSEGVRIEG